MAERTDVMISSTARDLPEHRKEAMDACLRQGMYPIMMEHLPASDSEAIAASLKMVDEAEIYLGIFAYRYGYVPKGHDISVTEMEYNRAVDRKIPRLIFIMGENHPIKGADVEKSDGAAKLEAFKNRVKTENIINEFDSPADLRAKIIDSLSKSTLRAERRKETGMHSAVALDIPQAPEPYIAHPYMLLQTSQLVGRQQELNLLTDWVAKPSSDLYRVRVLNIVAIGGMGKSALTWKWFKEIAEYEMKPLAGRLWWSFYESDGRFENFVIRALAYVSGRPREEVEKLPPPEREERLLHILDTQPFLLVLDGLERILNAYARMDAAYLRDDELDEKYSNYVTGAIGLPESAAQSFVGQHKLRKAADPRVGSFLKRLAMVQKSRILISTRLYPTELQMDTGHPLPSCAAIFLTGLADADALDLWRAMGVSGSRAALLLLFKSFENYPLLIRALAGEVARFRRKPGDFDAWRKTNPDFNPLSLPLMQVKSHVLGYAMQGLDAASRKLLETVAAFRMPVSYEMLFDIIKGKQGFLANIVANLSGRTSLISDEKVFDRVLKNLEDRGLLGWDKSANRYDLHPIVRGVVWEMLNADARRTVYQSLHSHFEAIPNPFSNWQQVNTLEDLTPAIELYNTLIGLRRYEDAVTVFRDRLEYATLYRLSTNRQNATLLEMLFPDGLDELPRLSDPKKQSIILNSLALTYQFSGQPGRAAPLYSRYISISEKRNDEQEISIGLRNLSNALRLNGKLREAEAADRRALSISREQKDHFREAISLYWLGLALAAHGDGFAVGAQHVAPLHDYAEIALRRSLRLFIDQNHTQGEGQINAYLAQTLLWRGHTVSAQPLADRAWELAHHRRFEADFIQAARLQGEAALGLGELLKADERLHHALSRARAVNRVEEELPALITLAEMARQQGEMDKARERLDEVWEYAECGPYPLFHSDAFNVLTQIEQDAGNTAKAVEAATRAYELAWCDGISADGEQCYAYWWGLKKAKAHLEALGAKIPQLKPFDESEHEPMVAVDWDAIMNDGVD